MCICDNRPPAQNETFVAKKTGARPVLIDVLKIVSYSNHIITDAYFNAFLASVAAAALG